MDPELRLVLIYGSVREGRLCDTVATWVQGQIGRRPDFRLTVYDPAAEQADAQRLRSALGSADAVVIVTPEYNHSFPGPLKALIDSAGAEWAAKPVAFVSYGGVSGGLRAVEHLRGVFAELHAVTVRECVSFPNAWETFRPDGRPNDEARYVGTMRKLLDQLAWWARALKSARQARSYGEAA